ncbi:cutinase family protein [Corynebacterium neomassiliense]|uniref:cutinase family protein n=1 Tax=Corynebacterium neomassiliense TaxID=2079482 RepID=UPI00102FABF2|nr:cutinase family protein [Corynebacterium neomassiliense]
MSVPYPPYPPHKPALQRRPPWLLIIGALVLAIALVTAVVVIAVRSGSSSSIASCADVEFIGAAGSSQRDIDPSSGTTEIADSGVGGIVEDTYQNLAVDLPEGTDINLRAVEYPAMAVPVKPTVDNWTAFLNSVSTGASEAEQLIRATMDECGDSKIVVAGYSQGAMAVHRALRAIGPDDRITAGVLIGDGDKVPDDNVETIPEYDTDARQGIAQVALANGINSGAVNEVLPPEWNSRIISPCMSGDVVCAPNSFALLRVTAHVSYDADDWRGQLLSKVTT